MIPLPCFMSKILHFFCYQFYKSHLSWIFFQMCCKKSSLYYYFDFCILILIIFLKFFIISFVTYLVIISIFYIRKYLTFFTFAKLDFYSISLRLSLKNIFKYLNISLSVLKLFFFFAVHVAQPWPDEPLKWWCWIFLQHKGISY